ncbi:CvpA family protein [Flavobacterium sp. F-380]|uniref:CvpA family protein n=1 Tax=Flavobacterium kayseriense TaxID=2764714 RepID=A0ABR7J4K5_9FLAO|nr:CvpA family protein [Flavobacterium kayseriense]MBC5840366.1 CvpA family protein [Flavobacterium kayseriense]MBC5846964.1 CvpA family protein [Flavobacterium kayseriense]
MGFLDIVLGVLLAYSLYKGIVNGLFVEIASLISLILGIYFAIKFSFLMRDALGGFLHWKPNTIQTIAFILTFILVVIGVTFLAKILTGVADLAFLGWINKLGGGFFRVLKTVLLLGIVFTVFEKVNYNNYIAKKETLDASLFYNPIHKTAQFFYPSLEKWYGEFKTKTSNTTEEEKAK